jgi:acyl-homoserine lactone acylase PvdQ
MKRLQNDYFNVTAEDARPLLLRYLRESELNEDAKRYLDIFKKWDLRASPDSKGKQFINYGGTVWRMKFGQTNYPKYNLL